MQEQAKTRVSGRRAGNRVLSRGVRYCGARKGYFERKDHKDYKDGREPNEA